MSNNDHRLQAMRWRWLAVWVCLIGPLVSLFLAAVALPAQAAASSDPGPQGLISTCQDGQQASGAAYRICMPNAPFFPWNGDVIIYAHGYVAVTEPVGLPLSQLRLPDGTDLADAAAYQGYAFAASGYSVNGLAVRQGLADLVDLVAIFKAAQPTAKRFLIIGASEGGLITALAVEKYPQLFSGGAALCGPIGDFQSQINYFGDFRVAFDYFFPGLMPASPISIPQSLINTWDSYYAANILPAILNPANALSVTQLLTVTGAAVDPANYTQSVSTTIYSVLWYNVYATNDATAKLGGQPFDNQTRVYTGSLDDARLNLNVQRFGADQAAQAEVQAYYQTSARPRVPLVTQHTRLDQTVPYRQAELYQARVTANGFGPRHEHLAVSRYGHCSFDANDINASLAALAKLVASPPPLKVFLPFLGRP